MLPDTQMRTLINTDICFMKLIKEPQVKNLSLGTIKKGFKNDFKNISSALNKLEEQLEQTKQALLFLSEFPFPTTVKIDKDGKPVTINDYCKNVLKLTKEK